MRHRFDRVAFLRTLILSGFAGYFYSLVSTGRVLLYIHPRMVFFVQASVVLFAGMALFQAREILTIRMRRYPNYRFGYVFLVLPVFLAFSGPAAGISAQMAGQKPLRLGAGDGAVSMDALFNRGAVVDLSEELKAMDTAGEEGGHGISHPSSDDNTANIHGHHILNFSQENFIHSLAAIHDDMEAYIGVPVTIEGFIYRNGLFAPDEFVVARYLMSCCAADTQVVGLFCSYAGIEDFPPNGWVRLHGILDTAVFQNEKIPVLRVDDITEIVIPANPYLYQ